MTQINLEIKTCQECPFFTRERYWTEDSWEEAHNWYCNKNEKKKIQGYVEWHEAKKIEVPEWCPIKS